MQKGYPPLPTVKTLEVLENHFELIFRGFVKPSFLKIIKRIVQILANTAAFPSWVTFGV